MFDFSFSELFASSPGPFTLSFPPFISPQKKIKGKAGKLLSVGRSADADDRAKVCERAASTSDAHTHTHTHDFSVRDPSDRSKE